MTTLSTDQLRSILVALNNFAAEPADFIISLAKNAELVEDKEALRDRVEEVLDVWKQSPGFSNVTIDWARKLMMEKYAEQILTLVSSASGLRFSASNATEERFSNIDIDSIAADMRKHAPDLWDLLGILLDADPKLREVREKRKKGNKSQKNSATGEIDVNYSIEGDSDSWERYTPKDLVNDEDWEDTGVDAARNDVLERRMELLIVKQVSCWALSACMHAPNTAVELLAHIGVSISSSAIEDAISSLSRESLKKIQELSCTLLNAYAYDNVDIDLKQAPSLENPFPSFIHLTSGTFIPLQHGVTLEDLNCSDELWQKSEYNRHRTSNFPSVSDFDLLMIHPEDPDHPSGLLRHERFNQWIFLCDLVTHGPDYFQKFRPNLHADKPESIDCIPVVKSEQIHARMMDLACSTPAENAQIIKDLLSKQGGVGDPNDAGISDPGNKKRIDLGNHVVLLFGDLGVGERVESLLRSRSEEKTRWRRLQGLVYVLGLFHVKMACADAVWRTFIEPARARNESDDYSLMADVKVLRPRETGKISSKPGFRRMHEVIQHSGIVMRLDCWRL
ncbi:hypothetical protein K435DRAFT_860227 [Dendrothele bispora CBS 962.96]|uniref:DUF6589 domain-containing protein n=1 Tax=Dendrothele bispora (strain CBS 962.96) TaxID=1314807 RepID=A0A4S8LYH8_DENBC|nr:hypothetical protein K435DRAFT_860227 [Dendrothele bispora CBS 962.96]